MVYLLILVWTLLGCRSLLAMEFEPVHQNKVHQNKVHQDMAHQAEMPAAKDTAGADLQDHACCSSGSMLPLPVQSETSTADLQSGWSEPDLWGSYLLPAPDEYSSQNHAGYQAGNGTVRQLAFSTAPPLFLNNCTFLI